MIRIFSGMSCFYVGVTGLTNNDVLINFLSLSLFFILTQISIIFSYNTDFAQKLISTI